jgi:hypothetical protein
LRVVKPAARPVARTLGLQPPDDRKAAERPLPQFRIWIEVVDIEPPIRGARSDKPDDFAAQLAAALEDLHGYPVGEKPYPFGHLG